MSDDGPQLINVHLILGVPLSGIAIRLDDGSNFAHQQADKPRPKRPHTPFILIIRR
jgi:hypothetical protein